MLFLQAAFVFITIPLTRGLRSWEYTGVVKFQSTPLDSPTFINAFFQFETRYTHAYVFIKLCSSKKFEISQFVVAQKICDCQCAGASQLDMIMQRSMPGKGLLFDFQSFPTGAGAEIQATFEANENHHNFFGIPVAKGPGHQHDFEPADPTEMYKYYKMRRKDFVVLKFSEQVLDGHSNGYSADQMTDLKNMWEKFNKMHNIYVMFDAHYLVATTDSLDLVNLFPHAWFAFYLLPGHEIAQKDIGNLKRRLMALRDFKVTLFLPDQLMDRINSYLPTAAWESWPTLGNNIFPKPVADAFKAMLVGNRDLLYLEAIECDHPAGTFFSVSQWCNVSDAVSLDHLFQTTIAAASANVFLRYHSPKLFNQVQFEFLKHAPFVVLNGTHGPNAAEGDILDRVSNYNKQANVRFVVGFAERSGSAKGYVAADIQRMVAFLGKTFGSKQFGLRLRADFLGDPHDVKLFEPLASQEKLQWILLYQDLGQPLTGEQIMYVKLQLRAFNRTTFLFIPDVMRNELYIDKEIPVDPPTLPTITTTPFSNTTTKTTMSTSTVPFNTSYILPPLTLDAYENSAKRGGRTVWGVLMANGMSLIASKLFLLG